MNAYRWLPLSVILANERFKLWFFRFTARTHPDNPRALELVVEQEIEVRKWEAKR